MVAQTAAFKKAVEDSRKLKAKPNNDELLEVRTLTGLSVLIILSYSVLLQSSQSKVAHMLMIDWVNIQLYANYKQGTGEDFSKATQPGTFAFQVRVLYLPLTHSLPLPFPCGLYCCTAGRFTGLDSLG